MKGPVIGIVITRRTGSLFQDRRGQTTVLFALTIMIFICFLAFMVNVGQLVHGRILTQAVADMVALSAANVQAAGMNEIADLNHEHKELQDDFHSALGYRFRSESRVRRLWDYFEGLMDRVSDYKKIVNRDFPRYVRNAANRTLSWYNAQYGGFSIVELRQSDRQGQLVPLERTARYQWRGRYLERDSQASLKDVYDVQYIRNNPVYYSGERRGYTRYYYRTLDTPYERKRSNGDRVYVIAKISREEMGALIAMESQGFNVKIPRMVAISAAMPTGGSVVEGRPTYFARFVPLEAFVSGGYHH